MDLPLRQKLFYFFPVLFCFCLPFGSLLLSGIVVFWVITSFFNVDAGCMAKGFRNRNLWMMYAFFLLTVLSSFLSSNKTEALFSIEVKMAVLLFPYLLFCFPWPMPILKRCIVSFVSGCFFACLYLIVRAFLFFIQGSPEYFFYSSFSDFIHTSYFAMYLVLAATFVLVLYPKWFSTQKSVIYSSWFFVAIFITSIFLCSSKLGIISFFVCGFMLLLYKWKLAIDLRKMVMLSAGAIFIGLVLWFFFPAAVERMSSLITFSSSEIDRTSAESTTVRVLIWEESINIIRNHFFTGTGVGDANDDLYAAYNNAGLTGAYKLKLNAHNQFLQTFIGMGIFGLFSLLLLTFGDIVRAVLFRNFLLFIFSLLITMNFLVESMLQRSAGVLFFSFFFCFLHLVREKELTDDPVMT
jgi:O-antigen ligase